MTDAPRPDEPGHQAEASLRLAEAMDDVMNGRQTMTWFANGLWPALMAIEAEIGSQAPSIARQREGDPMALVEDFADRLVAIIDSRWVDYETAQAAVKLWRRDLAAAIEHDAHPTPEPLAALLAAAIREVGNPANVLSADSILATPSGQRLLERFASSAPAERRP